LATGTTARKPFDVPSGSDSDNAKPAGKKKDDESKSSNCSMKGDGVIRGKDKSKSSRSDLDVSSKDTTKTGKATSI
jgi:hypothetical protein